MVFIMTKTMSTQNTVYGSTLTLLNEVFEKKLDTFYTHLANLT